MLFRSTITRSNNVLLFDLRANSTYLAQSGLIGAPDGQAFPNHRSPMQVADAAGLPRQLAASGEAAGIQLVAESGGVRLERTLKLARGSYVLEVNDKVVNIGSQTVSPTLYLQLTRDSNPPPGGSDLYSTYVGPVVYTDKEKFQKVDFADIEKGKARHATTASDGWLGIIQHYFVAAWIPADKLARLLFIGGALITVAVLGALFAASAALVRKPLATLTRSVDALGAGRYDQSVPGVDGGDEIG